MGDTPPIGIEWQEALKLKQIFAERYGRRKSSGKIELVAAFLVGSGRIVAYYVYKRNRFFELTEKRQGLMQSYYAKQKQYVIMYENLQRHCEYYHAISFEDAQAWPAKTGRNALPWRQALRDAFCVGRAESGATT